MAVLIKAFEDVGKVFGEVRTSLGLSQSDMFLKAGYSQQQIHRIESGSNITVKTLLEVADALGLEVTIKKKSSKTFASSKHSSLDPRRKSKQLISISFASTQTATDKVYAHQKRSTSTREAYKKGKASPALLKYGHLLSSDDE